MNTNGNPLDPQSPRFEPDVAESNLVRLLGQAYRPEHLDPAFVQRVHDKLQSLARELANKRPSPYLRSPRAWWPLAAAAALVGLILGLHSLLNQFSGPSSVGTGDPFTKKGTPGYLEDASTPMMARARPSGPAIPKANINDTLKTEIGQRRRWALPDGSILYLNQNTLVTITKDRHLELERGEVFLEVAPREPGFEGATFIVTSHGRELAALGTKFAVSAAEAGPDLVVTQGKVKVTVSGIEQLVLAGQILKGGGGKPEAAPRASHVLDWTRDLMAESESPLVPGSKFQGGALLAKTQDGRDAQITFRKYHIDVHIEDGFVRTTIDQTYWNHDGNRLEGRFLFPLPADSQLSRLAMYVDGQLMEGGMVERQEARDIFESIVYRQKDPALLEWLDGTTFQMRVFPLEPRQEKRIILSYTQKLSTAYGRSQYRFPSRHSLNDAGEWSFHATIKRGANLRTSDTHQLKATRQGDDLILDGEARNVRVDHDIVVEWNEPASGPVRFSTVDHEGNRYLMLRYRPEIVGHSQRQRRDWVFLVETSGQRDTLLARVQVDVVKTLLAHAGHDDTFSILTAATRTRMFADKPMPATPANVASAITWLETRHLVGGLDLASSLKTASQVLQKMEHPYLVHLGSGMPTLGEHQEEALLKLLPKGTPYVGVALGHRWGRGFMKGAAEQSGGLIAQINPDEAVAWRAFELFGKLGTPRLVNVQVVDAETQSPFLCHDTIVSQGEEICAVARIQGDRERSLTVTGTIEGQPFKAVIPVKDPVADAGYLPRTWAKLEIDRLLADDPSQNKARIIALSKDMYVMTPFTSLLVLENEAMYAQFKVDRGRKDHWALYDCPKKLPAGVVNVPPPVAVNAHGSPGRKPGAEVLKSIHVHPWLTSGNPTLLSHLHPLPHHSGLNAATPGLAGQHLMAGGGFGSLWPITSTLSGKGSPNPPVVGPVLPSSVIPMVGGTQAFAGHGGMAPFQGGIPRNKIGGGSPPIVSPPIVGTPGSGLFADDGPNELLLNLVHGTGQTLDLVERWSAVIVAQKAPVLPVYPQHLSDIDPRVFSNLLAHAPGLNTTSADVLAVLAAESIDADLPTGKLDEEARNLIDKARSHGWRTVTFLDANRRPLWSLTCDGSGRFIWERTLINGLKEQVVCDGKNLWHLYPELGLGTRRTLTRFHLMELAGLLPWVLPSPEDLARGADVQRIEDRVVAVVPHDKNNAVLHLVFGDDGRLVQRRLMDRASGQATSRIDCDPDARRERVQIQAAATPELTPETKGLLIVPMPVRTREQVAKTQPMDDESAVRLMLAHLPTYKGDVETLVTTRFAQRAELHRGLTVLLCSAGVAPTALPWVNQTQTNAGLRYYLWLNERAKPGKKTEPPRGDGLLPQLASLEGLARSWTSTASAPVTEAEAGRLVEHIGTSPAPGLTWLLLQSILAGEHRPVEAGGGRSELVVRLLTTFARVSERYPALAFLVQYEWGVTLHGAGQVEEGRKTLRDAVASSIKKGSVPPLDHRALAVLGADGLTDLLRTSATEFMAHKHWQGFVVLAWQGAAILNPTVLEKLLHEALSRSKDDAERTALTLAIAQFLGRHNQVTKAEALVDDLLQEPSLNRVAGLWRLRAWLALDLAQNNTTPSPNAMVALEKALDLEYQSLPAVIDLKAIRRDYGLLLKHYQKVGEELTKGQQPVPRELIVKIVKAADRWRSLESDPTVPCREAAQALKLPGWEELASDYLATPIPLEVP